MTETNPTELVERLERLSSVATPAPWHLCQHLKSMEDDTACPCGYRGVVSGPEHDDMFAVFQPGHELPRHEEEWGTEPARYPREVEIANSQLIVAMRNALPDLLATITRLTAENERLREGLGHIFANFADRAQAPGHSHDVPGIWDDDISNGELAGKPCDWCAKWNAARSTLGEQP
jgi:hypothetical protein